MLKTMVIPVYSYTDKCERNLALGQLFQLEDDEGTLKAFYVYKELSSISDQDYNYAIDNDYIRAFAPLRINGDEQFLYGKNQRLYASTKLRYDDYKIVSVRSSRENSCLYLYTDTNNTKLTTLGFGFYPNSDKTQAFIRSSYISDTRATLELGIAVNGNFTTNMYFSEGKSIQINSLSEGLLLFCPTNAPKESFLIYNISSNDDDAKTYLQNMDKPTFLIGGKRDNRDNRLVFYWTNGNGDVYRSNIYGSSL